MRISLTASLFLLLGLIHPVRVSFSAPLEDLEGSGYDLDNSGSGSGDESEHGEIKKDRPNSKDVRIIAGNPGGGTKNTFQDSSILDFDSTHKDGGSGYIVVANSKSFLDNKEILAAVIAGGVTGFALAAALAAILIYSWQKKDNGGYILGQQRAPDEGYHRPNREEVVVV